jgi:hypothetical protein
MGLRERFGHRWLINIKMVLEKVLCVSADVLLCLRNRVQWRNVMNTAINIRVS